MYFEVLLGTFGYFGGIFWYFGQNSDAHLLYELASLCCTLHCMQSARHIDLISRGQCIGKSIFEPARLVFICQMATLITLKSKSPWEKGSGAYMGERRILNWKLKQKSFSLKGFKDSQLGYWSSSALFAIVSKFIIITVGFFFNDHPLLPCISASKGAKEGFKKGKSS